MFHIEHIQKLGIIALVNLIVYYKTLFYGYVGDDVERAERKQEFKNVFHRWWLQFIGLKHINSMVSHFITLITHTVCCLMIYLALGKNNISFLTAILFSINPVNMQGSVWISGRNYVISAIFTLLMLLLPKFSLISYAATSHFAVNAWFAPLVFLGTPYWYMVGIIPIVWLLMQHNRDTLNRKLWQTGGLKTTNTEMRAIKLKKLIPFVKTYLYYFILCIFPHSLSVEHKFLRGFGTNKHDNAKGYKLDKFFYMGAVLFTFITGLSIWCIFNGWNSIAWGLFFFTVNIAMWCNFVTYQQHIAERYCYLANIGLMYALANTIIVYPVLSSAFITGYAVRLWYAMDMYLNDWWVVEYSIREIKDMDYMWLMRGVKKYMMKDFVGALYDFNEAYLHKPYDIKILYNLTLTIIILGDIEKAKFYLSKARENIYDELGDTVTPLLDNLDNVIKTVEEAKAKGEKQISIDLSKIQIVK